ncbi:MAG: type II secretion system protein J [Acidobacteriota bacterium]
MKRKNGQGGFTLLEVMVALIIGTMVMGGVMGMMSASLRFSQRIKAKSQVQPVLEAAAQEVLARPADVQAGTVTLATFPGTPVVEIALAEVPGADGKALGSKAGKLNRVQLRYGGQILEFSMLIPQAESSKLDFK